MATSLITLSYVKDVQKLPFYEPDAVELWKK